MSSSALIPFCEFGGDMARLGTMISRFPLIPVCNVFQAIILNDQLCYEVDLKNLSKSHNIDNELKLGFYFVMDYNEDRQVTFTDEKNSQSPMILSEVLDVDDHKHAFIHLDTIGKSFRQQMYFCSLISRTFVPLQRYIDTIYLQYLFLEKVTLKGEGVYNLNGLKEITATDSYLSLDQDTKGCQNEEPMHKCTTRQFHETVLNQCGCLPVSYFHEQDIKVRK